MTPLQILQNKLDLKADGQIGPITFGALAMKWKLTPIQLAHFLGQCDHESGGFKIFEENMKYSKERLLKVFKKYYTPDLAEKHEFKPTVIANHVYGGRMGNTEINDGWSYRGRGVLQLTGRYNYTEFAKWIGDLSIIDSPSQVADKYSFEAALWYFQKNKLFDHCVDLSDKTIEKISKGVNLGNINSTRDVIHLEERIQATKKYGKFVT